MGRQWASTDSGRDPDVVLACAGRVPTLEMLGTAAAPRKHLPRVRVRVVNVYVHCVRSAVAAMAASMHGLDALTVTAGVGEHSPRVRTAVCERLEFPRCGSRYDTQHSAGRRRDRPRRERLRAGAGHRASEDVRVISAITARHQRVP